MNGGKLNTKTLVSIFEKLSKSQHKIDFLNKNMQVIQLSEKKVKLGKQLGKGVFGKVFVLKNKKNRVIKLIGRGYAQATYDKIGPAILNKNIHEQNVISCMKYLTDAFLESYNIYKAEKTKITPKFFNLYLVKIGKKLYPAIEMQHIPGINFLKYFYRNRKNVKISQDGNIEELPNQFKSQVFDQQLMKRFRMAKLKHNDIHLGNMIVTKRNKVKVIDFSPEFIGHKFSNGKRYKFFIVESKKYSYGFNKLKIRFV